ncbi:MAG: zinc ribbon domain-containing protein [Desulfobacteraceae bacterium]|jgi:putative FmdB family regulatory protein|nr:zinc ribbon domain-containing protein [Desulfobacteraceae bacterium]
MPIYEYHCQKCGHDFEYLLLGAEEPECQACHSKEVCRLMSTCGFVSKGSGGQTLKTTAATSSCSGCSASSCAGCGH